MGAGQGGSNGIKVGSFQEYVKHDFVVEDLSPSLLPVKEVSECLTVQTVVVGERHELGRYDTTRRDDTIQLTNFQPTRLRARR